MFADKLFEIARFNGYSVIQAKNFFMSMNEEELSIAESGEIRKAIGAMYDRQKASVDDDDE